MLLSEKQLREMVDQFFGRLVNSLSSTLVSLKSALVTGAFSVAGQTTLGSLVLTKAAVTLPDTTAYVLSATEELSGIVVASGTPGGSTDIEATPTDGKVFIVKNGTPTDIVFKANGQSGVTLTTGVVAIVMGNGTDFESVAV